MHLTYKLVHFFWQKIRKTTRNRDKDLEKGKQHKETTTTTTIY
jgi:hypothetical protein